MCLVSVKLFIVLTTYVTLFKLIPYYIQKASRAGNQKLLADVREASRAESQKIQEAKQKQFEASIAENQKLPKATSGKL